MPREAWMDDTTGWQGDGSPARSPGSTARRAAREPEGGGWVWPLAITVGLLLVIAVNVGFVVVAVNGADEVVESYRTEER